MDDPVRDDVNADAADPEPEPQSEPPTKPLNLKGSFGTALGAAMLGFEQALRSEPPPEVRAAQHMPERGHAGDGVDVVIEIPDPAAGDERKS